MYGTGIARTLELSCCALLPKYVFYISICTYPLDNGENQKIQPDFNIKTQSYVYLYIQCIIQSRDRKHDYLLTLQILDIQVLKKKESGAHRLSRVKCTVQVEIKSNLNFPHSDVTEAFILQSRNKAHLVLQECRSTK